MSEPARRLLTYEDLLAADEPGGPVPELIDGQIRYKASPRPRHSRGQWRVPAALSAFDPDEPGDQGWWLLVEPDLLLSTHRVVRPDVAGWRRARLPDVPDRAIRVLPDWVCELLSPGYEAHDTVTKRAIYLEEGVPWLWLVHPEERTLEAFQSTGGRWVLLGTYTAGDRVRIPPFEAIELDVGALYWPERPRPGRRLGEDDEAGS